jgi:hypothetical protein
MKICPKKILLVSLFFGSQTASAIEGSIEDRSKLDVSFKMGAYAGEISRPNISTGEYDTFQFGGVPIIMVLNNNYSPNASAIMQVGLVTDLVNDQVSRQGFDAGIAYHVFGGSKFLSKQSRYSSRVWKNPYNLSVVLLGGMHHYAASDKADISTNVTGAVFETSTGIQYRHDVSDEKSMGLDIMGTVFTLPASVDRIEPRGIEISLFWRFLM